MLKKLLILTPVFLMPIVMFAQPKPGNQEKIEQIKADFIKQKLELTPAEAQAFWPVYNDFQQKKENLRKQRDEAWKKAKDNVETMSDKDFDALVENEITIRQKELDLQKDFNKKLKLILPSKKIAKYYLAEDEFRKKLAELIKQK